MNNIRYLGNEIPNRRMEFTGSHSPSGLFTYFVYVLAVESLRLGRVWVRGRRRIHKRTHEIWCCLSLMCIKSILMQYNSLFNEYNSLFNEYNSLMCMLVLAGSVFHDWKVLGGATESFGTLLHVYWCPTDVLARFGVRCLFRLVAGYRSVLL